MADGWDVFPQAGGATVAPDPWAAFPAADVAAGGGDQPARITVRPQPQGPLENALAPIANYPEAYGQFRNQAVERITGAPEQINRGASQLATGENDRSPRGPIPISSRLKAVGDILAGIGRVPLGAAEFTASPIAAGLHTVVGEPFKNTMGIPEPISEAVAGAFLPIPKRIPFVGRAAKPFAEAANPTTETLLGSYEPAYEAVRGKPVPSFEAPTGVAALKSDIMSALRESGARPYNSSKTFQAVDELDSLTSASKVGDVEGIRKALRKAANDPAERDAASLAIAKLDEKLGVEIPELAAVRGDYATGKQSQQLDEAIAKAERSKAPYGEAIKSELRSILNSPNRRRGYSNDVLARMDAITRGTYAGNAAEFLSGITGGHGGLRGTITGVFTKGVAPVAGAVTGKLGSLLTEQQVAKLSELIRSEAPMAQRVVVPLKEWNAASQEFETTKNARNYARLTIASRNLSNNLADFGVQVAPDRLIGINRPVAAGDQQEQP